MMYFSQNNPVWKDNTIGKSASKIGDYGCTISCIATGGTWFGELHTPAFLAKNLSFLTDRVIWSSIEKVYKNMKFLWRFYSLDKKLINEALKNKDKVVLLNISNGKHWVFARYEIPFFGYLTQDPYPYPSKMRRVSSKEIVGGAVLVRK